MFRPTSAFPVPAPARRPVKLPSLCVTPSVSILPAPGVEHLRCRTSASGYRNVYEHGVDANGCVRYVAKVKFGGRLRSLPDGRSTMPHVSAAAVVRWYQGRFGTNWPAALKRRKCNPQKVWYSKSRRCWLAAVWLWGLREEVRPVTRRGDVVRDSEPCGFWTREDAVRSCLIYAVRRQGLLYRLAMWRG